MKPVLMSLMMLLGLGWVGRASIITIDGTMSLAWQYDLATNEFNNITLPVMDVQVVINDTNLVGGNGSYNLTGVEIDDSLFGLLGYDTSAWAELDNSANISNETSWNETWITFVEDLSGPDGGDERWMEFNSGPLMADPNNFTSAEFEADLFSQAYVGGSWGMRDDGNGLQNLISGTIDSITVTDTSTPEPTTAVFFGIGVLGFAVLKRSRFCRSKAQVDIARISITPPPCSTKRAHPTKLPAKVPLL